MKKSMGVLAVAALLGTAFLTAPTNVEAKAKKAQKKAMKKSAQTSFFPPYYLYWANRHDSTCRH